METETPANLLLHGDNETRIWGMSNAERTRRLASKLDQGFAGQLWANLDYVYDPQWIRYISDHSGMALTLSGIPVLAHVRNSSDAEMLMSLDLSPDMSAIEHNDMPRIHNHALRKLDTPFANLLTPQTVKATERQSYFGAYKGVTDVLTKYLWPELALMLTRFAARMGMTPNMVTAIGAIGCLAATFLFYYGYFWTGMVAGFVFMVLDTVDGKLARCTVTSSYWGNIFDHGLDLVHPPFWWVAWAMGLGSAGLALPADQFRFVIAVILGGYVFQRVLELIFIWAFNQHMHVWRKFDSRFRLITARRNPNMIILFVSLLAGRPDIGLIAVAWWTLVSLVVHIVQIVQAFTIKARGGKITSWLEEKEEITT